MRTTIDKAGRLVLPKQLRDRVGLIPGQVEVFVDGAGIRIEPISRGHLSHRAGRCVVPPTGIQITDDLVQALRDADQQ
jgi:AbrB family looped-hinge helix DNA binding protein